MMSPAATIRAFTPADKAACLAIFDSNTPQSFAPFERAEFARFLETSRAPFFVATATDGMIVGCGGYYLDAARRFAGLTWGMVHRGWQGRGIGGMLLRFRIAAVEASTTTCVIGLNTNQHSRGFFERHGFDAARVIANGFAPGLDRVEMERRTKADLPA